VYEDIDSGNTTDYKDGLCLSQLSNHITRNLLKNVNVMDLDDETLLTDEEKVTDALDSIRNRFTVVGVMEQLEESIDLFSYSFPWLSVELEGNAVKCNFPHSNGSPKNNRCGENHSHWELPDEPDDETWKIIEEHNKLDMQVYEAALEIFELQKRAVLLDENIE